MGTRSSTRSSSGATPSLTPVAAVIFAELLARSAGYGLSELGVTINGQSSSIMSILVLGAGTDYALLIVARYREELHHRLDRHEAMAAAMRSAGAAGLASAATVIAALFCLTIAQGKGATSGRLRRRIAEGSRLQALLPVIGASLIVLLLLPLVLLNALLRKLTRGFIPSVIFGPLDRNVFKPYEVRRFRHEHLADETHGFWKRVGDWVARNPKRVAIGSVGILLVLALGLTSFSTDLTTNDSYRTEVESVEGQEILSRSFPAGASAPADIVVPNAQDVAGVRSAVSRVDGVEGVSGPVAQGDSGVLVQAVVEAPPYSTQGVHPIEPIP